jgi:hypothetical protein
MSKHADFLANKLIFLVIFNDLHCISKANGSVAAASATTEVKGLSQAAKRSMPGQSNKAAARHGPTKAGA